MNSRRELLGAIGLAVGVAGCLSSVGNDDPEPIDVDHTALAATADIQVPSVPEAPPVDVADSYVVSQRDQVEGLLEPIPPDLTAEIPNEAVRSYIEEKRTAANEDLDEVAGSRSNYAAATALAEARRHAGQAEGAYAAARGYRTREDVYGEIEPHQDRLATVSDGLERVGTVPHRVALVYEIVEGHLDRANPENRGVRQPSAVSETEAVGAATGTLEYNRANLDLASHIADNRTGDRFDDAFERIARELVSDRDGRPGDLPETADEIAEIGSELFDATVSGTPRTAIARTLYFTSKTAAGISEEIDDGRLGTALMDLSRYEHTRRTVDSVQAQVASGSYDRPADAAAVRRAKENAIDAVESVLTEPAYPALIRRHLQRQIYMIENADRDLERDRQADNDVLDAVGQYALATERARTLPGTVEWFVAQLA